MGGAGFPQYLFSPKVVGISGNSYSDKFTHKHFHYIPYCNFHMLSFEVYFFVCLNHTVQVWSTVVF